jgi:hypothetical protein
MKNKEDKSSPHMRSSDFASQNKEDKSSAPVRTVAFLLRKNKEDYYG